MPATPQRSFYRQALAVCACAVALTACGRGNATPIQPVPVASLTPTAPPTATSAPTASAPTGTPVATSRVATAAPPTVSVAATASPTPTVPTNTVVERGVLAPGFSLTVYGAVTRPTSLTFGPDGRLYVASVYGGVWALADADGDHRAEAAAIYAAGPPIPLGLAWVDDTLLISYTGAVAAARDTDGDGEADRVRDIVTGLPSAGLHQNDGLALGADGYVYLGQGSTCDHCREADARSGAILRFRPDGTQLSVYATGLRNPYDLAFNAAGHLFATDNGRDDLGWDAPAEELNHIRAGADYGWPDCWTGQMAGDCAATTPAVATFSPHTSADGLVFYSGAQFPPEYADNAFVAVLGIINLLPDHPERGLVRVRLTPAGDTYTSVSEWFLELPDGRPVDLTVGPDGALYVADYINDAVYRIVYGAP